MFFYSHPLPLPTFAYQKPFSSSSLLSLNCPFPSLPPYLLLSFSLLLSLFSLTSCFPFPFLFPFPCPFNSFRLKPLMERNPDVMKFIVNVSAMEGKFYRWPSIAIIIVAIKIFTMIAIITSIIYHDTVTVRRMRIVSFFSFWSHFTPFILVQFFLPSPLFTWTVRFCSTQFCLSFSLLHIAFSFLIFSSLSFRFKSANHPHTNMAKASLNMMTRTSAQVRMYILSYNLLNKGQDCWPVSLS